MRSLFASFFVLTVTLLLHLTTSTASHSISSRHQQHHIAADSIGALTAQDGGGFALYNVLNGGSVVDGHLSSTTGSINVVEAMNRFLAAVITRNISKISPLFSEKVEGEVAWLPSNKHLNKAELMGQMQGFLSGVAVVGSYPSGHLLANESAGVFWLLEQFIPMTSKSATTPATTDEGVDKFQETKLSAMEKIEEPKRQKRNEKKSEDFVKNRVKSRGSTWNARAFTNCLYIEIDENGLILKYKEFPQLPQTNSSMMAAAATAFYQAATQGDLIYLNHSLAPEFSGTVYENNGRPPIWGNKASFLKRMKQRMSIQKHWSAAIHESYGVSNWVIIKWTDMFQAISGEANVKEYISKLTMKGNGDVTLTGFVDFISCQGDCGL